MRPLGTTGLIVSGVFLGGAPLGSMPENFGYEVSERDALALVRDILRSPIRVIDTSNGYSGGRSEKRIGEGVALAGGLPDDFLVTTKVDALGSDYSATRVRASVAESRKRLGIDVLPMVYLHDPEFHAFDDTLEAVDALVELKAAGTIGHIGLAGGDVHLMSRYLGLGVFEVILIHNRWTLVDHSAGELIGQAAASGVAVVNAAIYGGGILANGRGSNYGYRPASEETLRAIRAMDALCERAETDLATVALAASYRDPRVSATVVGFTRPGRIDSIMSAVGRRFPSEFWSELDDLLPARHNWLDFA
jgi:D-threo-aldose 1-dehydrogenase